MQYDKYVMLVSFAGVNGQHNFEFNNKNEAEEKAKEAIESGVFSASVKNVQIMASSKGAVFIIMPLKEYENQVRMAQQQMRMAQIAAGGGGPRGIVG